VWIKLGFFGFVAMLYLIGRAIYAGGRASMRADTADDLAVTLAGLGYVVMFAVFAYVDIGFGIRPIIYLALTMAICADFDPVSRQRRTMRRRSDSTPERLPSRSPVHPAGGTLVGSTT
jgi:hypothetical protein